VLDGNKTRNAANSFDGNPHDAQRTTATKHREFIRRRRNTANSFDGDETPRQSFDGAHREFIRR
jgi:hypothetical protein